MDPEKLKALQIKPEAKARPQRSLWIIFLGIGAITAAALYFAWPDKGGERRIGGGAPAKADSVPPNTATTASNAAPARVEGSVLTVSGYIVNRERIELSPRFMGVVKWIGVHKGDTVTNGQVVVLLDDAEQKARLVEAQGRLANAQTALAKAELDYQRIKKLIADKVETPQAEDHARLKVEPPRAMLQDAQGTAEVRKPDRDCTVIRPPTACVV